jgi:hypothetical protein
MWRRRENNEFMREGKREEKEKWRFERRREEVVEEKGRRSWEK